MEQNKDQSGAGVRGEAVAEELREIDVVLSENDRLREALADKISGETLLTELNMNQGGLSMQFEGGACQMLAEQFAQQFRDMGGDNYIEIGFTARSDGMPLLVTIQRVSGKTPATLKTEAEARLSTAKNFHRSLCERFGYSHDDKDWLRDLVSLEEFIAAKVSARAADAPSDLPTEILAKVMTRDDFDCSTELGYAQFLAWAIWLKSYRAVSPDFNIMGNLKGVLSQIDNMVCGLSRAADAPSEPREPQQKTIDCMDAWATSMQMPTYSELHVLTEQYDALIREICFQYAAGGYNSDGFMAPKSADLKLRWIIDEAYKSPSRAADALDSQPTESTADVQARVRDAVAANMTDLYICSRHPSAWGVGTMGLDDFSPAGEDEDVIENITDAVMATLAPASSQPTDGGVRNG